MSSIRWIDDDGIVHDGEIDIKFPLGFDYDRDRVNLMLEHIKRAQDLAVKLGLSFNPTMHCEEASIPNAMLEHAEKDGLGELVTLQSDRSAATAHVCYRLGPVDLFVVTRRGQQISQGEIDQAIARDRDREAALIQANAQAALI